MEKRKFLTYRDSNSDPSVVQPVAGRYTDCTIPAPKGQSLDVKMMKCVGEEIFMEGL
jgi:hypothetical protein